MSKSLLSGVVFAFLAVAVLHAADAAKLKDKDPNVRLQTVEELAALRVQGVTGQLTELLRKDPSPEVRQSVAIHLAQFGDPSVGPAVIQALNDPFDGVRFAAAQTLGRLKIREAIGPLSEKLKDPDPRMRRTAVYALKEIGRESLPMITAALTDSDPGVRQQAVLALGDLGDASAKDKLRETLNDPDAKVQVWAAWALAKLNDSSGRLHLDKLKDSKDPMIQQEATTALARLGVKPKTFGKPKPGQKRL